VVRELVERARQADLRIVFAHILAEENASTKVLTRCGFTRTAELTDPDEGRVWRWELMLRP
jgi:RimJ/RimL family protein N-acetyltransferase